MFAVLLGIGICASGAWGRTLRIVSYNIDCADQSSDNNITGSTHTLPTVVQAIGLHHIGNNAQPVDVMSCEELNSTTLANFVAQLNVIYGAGTYAFDPTSDPNTGGGTDGLIYRTNTVQVVSVRALPTGQTVLLQSNSTYTSAHSPGGGVNGVTRAPMVYQLRPVGFGTSDDFYFYVSHARSSSDDSVGDARYAEAQEVRSDAKYNLPAGAHILYGGDWNLFSGSGENAYKCLTGQTTSDAINWSDSSAIWANTNQTQGYDPTSKTKPLTTTTWANVSGDNASYLYDDSTDGSFATTSRIDIQLPNAPMFGVYNSHGGVQLATDTSDPFDSSNFPSAQYPYAFEVFGNNGSTPLNSMPTSSSNHSLDDLTNTVPSAATVYADLILTGSGSNFTGSDHYPIVGDYNIVPAAQSIKTVFIILEENQNWASISGNAACPYINNGLLPNSSYTLQYYNPPGIHPSLPNYLWLEAGTNFGILADGDALTYHESTTNHLVTLLKNAGISWTSFQEGITGTTCPLTDSGQYAAKHNPMVHFDDVTNTNNTGSTYCISNVRPYTELATDLASNTVTRYNFIVPNLCDDMHGNTGCLTGNALLTAGDTWLSNTVAEIVGSQAYSNNGAIFVTWDEGEGEDGPIGMIVLSPLAKGGGYANSIHYTHSSTLLMMQEIFNIGPLLGDAANATDLSDLFIFGAQLAVSPMSGFSSSGGAGGPFSPTSQTYTLSNTGGVTMVWSVTNTFNWLTISATSGTLAPSSTTNITISLNANANSLLSGSYSDTVVFTTSNGSGNTTEPVNLNISNASGQLIVTPPSGFSSGGPPGGPFNPISQTYAVSNAGGASVNWTANNSANWLSLSATTGTLASGASINITATLNANANSLAAGGYSDTIGFTNATNGAGNTTRAVNLNVGTFGFYDDFSTFSSGALVGQQNWTQLGAISTVPVQVTTGQAGFTGGLTANNQTPYKNFALTNETVFYGLTLTVTNAPNTNGVPYFVALYTSSNGTGTAEFRLAAESPNAARTNYVLGVRITLAPTDPYTFGVTGLSYGTQYRVIIQAVAGFTNAIMYVNPTSSNLGAQTQYAKNVITSGAASSVGSFAISQLDGGSIPGDGGLIGKVVVGDNFGTVYTDLLGALPPVASFTGSPTSGVVPLTVTFSDTSTGSITNWSWSFGDGGTTNLTTNSVLYTYNTAGVYSVTEIVSGPGGSGTNTQVNYITVWTPFQAWQVQYFGSTTNPAAAANVDPLGKGMSNFNQFLAGINPTNPASAFRITSVVQQGSDVLVTWTTAGGYTNVVQVNAGLPDGSYSTNFSDLSGLIVISGSGDAVTNYLDAGGATNVPARYYQIRLGP
jgi:PKD repeat protein